MKVRCLHGFFIFEEIKAGEVSDFMRYSGLKISPSGPFFTFDFLKSAPRYSIGGAPYLGFTALENFEGEPWEVFEANGIIYDFTLGVIKPIESVTTIAPLKTAGRRFISNGLILPGSLTEEGERVKDYAAHYSLETLRWLYSEVSFV